MAFDKEQHRERLDKIVARIEKIRAESTPMREARDKYANQARDKETELNGEISKVEKGLYDLEVERAFLTRALGSR